MAMNFLKFTAINARPISFSTFKWWLNFIRSGPYFFM